MKAIYILASFVFGAVAILTQAAEPIASGQAQVSNLPGSYQIVAGERDGTPIPTDRLRDISVRIANNAITTLDKDKKEVYVASYEIDTTKQPWQVRMTAVLTPVADAKGTTSTGLMEMDGETVKLIYALPGGERPSEFKTKDKQQMFVLRQTERLARESTNPVK